MKKLYKIFFLGGGGGGNFPGGNFPGGSFLGGTFPGGIFPGGIFPSTLRTHPPQENKKAVLTTSAYLKVSIPIR